MGEGVFASAPSSPVTFPSPYKSSAREEKKDDEKI